MHILCCDLVVHYQVKRKSYYCLHNISRACKGSMGHMRATVTLLRFQAIASTSRSAPDQAPEGLPEAELLKILGMCCFAIRADCAIGGRTPDTVSKHRPAEPHISQLTMWKCLGSCESCHGDMAPVRQWQQIVGFLYREQNHRLRLLGLFLLLIFLMG